LALKLLSPQWHTEYGLVGKGQQESELSVGKKTNKKITFFTSVLE